MTLDCLLCCLDVYNVSAYNVFFFKQKTAYEMRISDWSSDVCSSDLSWTQIRERDDYPLAVAELLGEATAAAALFTGHAKVDGRLSVQLRGEGPLRTLFTECTAAGRSEEHTSELQSLMRISYAVFCLKKKKTTTYYCSHANNTQIQEQM